METKAEKVESKKAATANKAEFIAILEEMESTEVEYKIRMAIIRLRTLVDKLEL